MAILGHLVLLDLKVTGVFQVLQARKALLEVMENLDLLDHQVHLEKGDCQECQASQDPKVIVDFQVWMVPKEKMGVLVKRVRMVLLVLLVPMALLDLQVPEESEEEMGHLEPLE